MIITVDKDQITYTFNVSKRKNQKRIIIKPKTTNSFTVTCPKYATKTQIKAMINQHFDTLKALKPIMDYNQYLNETSVIYLFDHPYKILTKEGRINDVVLKEDTLILTLKKNSDRQKVLKAFLKDYLKRAIYSIEQKYKAMNLIDLSNVTYHFRYLKSKFGSCEVNNHKIKFNLVLVHYPLQYLDYIYAHEIAHLKEPNHSKHFYAVLNQLNPSHKTLKKALNIHHTAFITNN